MTELEYYQYLAKNMISKYEELIYDKLKNHPDITEDMADREANETVREIADINLEEYQYILEDEFNLAYEAYLEKAGRNDQLFGFNIEEHIAILRNFETGWCKEINVVSWMDNPPRFDIRDWNPEHTHMTRGITLEPFQLKGFASAMNSYIKEKDVTNTNLEELDNMHSFNSHVTYSIIDTLASFYSNETGWSRELNLISWNGASPKFDIRDWNSDHTQLTRGITLSTDESMKLCEAMNQRGSFELKMNKSASKSR